MSVGVVSGLVLLSAIVTDPTGSVGFVVFSFLTLLFLFSCRYPLSFAIGWSISCTPTILRTFNPGANGFFGQSNRSLSLRATLML